MSQDPLLWLGAHVRSELELEGPAPSDEVLRVALSKRAAARRPRRRAIWFASLVFAAAAVAIAIFVHARGAEPAPVPITFTVGTPERPGALGQAVAAAPHAGTSLRFSDGSRVALDPGGRSKVTRLEASTVELELESGRAHVDVVPRVGSAWQVRSGPFSVRVTGTRFAVAWDAERDRFSLELFEGRVVVSGCSFGSGRPLVAGERAEAACMSRRHAFSSLDGADRSPRSETSDPVPLPEPQGVPAPVARDAPKPPANGSPATAPTNRTHLPEAASEDWTALARSGRYERAFELAASEDIASEARTRPAEDVLLLAETARLTGHHAEARSAYEKVRDRFPRSHAAAQAAFQLGRLEAQAGRRALAAKWFGTYLEEEPRGPLAVAALGRMLEARVALGDAREAREAAQSYLDQYPTGPHAEQAAKVLSAGASVRSK